MSGYRDDEVEVALRPFAAGVLDVAGAIVADSPSPPVMPSCAQSVISSHVPYDETLADLEEDLSECIAAWAEGGGAMQESQRAQGSGPAYPTVGRRRNMHSAGNRSTSSQAPEETIGPVISVNAGGSIFCTTASTLRKAPFFKEVLRNAKARGGGLSAATVDSEGSTIFVDRSGDLFGYILEYLRCGHWLLKDRGSDAEFMSSLRDEADFYGIVRDGSLAPRISEYVTVWQFQHDTSLYVDCFEQTIREDPDHQGLFRLCKYTGGLPLDQQTCTRRFKATTHSMQSVITYFAIRGFNLQHVVENAMLTHTTSADGQSRSGYGTQFVLSRLIGPDTQARGSPDTGCYGEA